MFTSSLQSQIIWCFTMKIEVLIIFILCFTKHFPFHICFLVLWQSNFFLPHYLLQFKLFHSYYDFPLCQLKKRKGKKKKSFSVFLWVSCFLKWNWNFSSAQNSGRILRSLYLFVRLHDFRNIPEKVFEGQGNWRTWLKKSHLKWD